MTTINEFHLKKVNIQVIIKLSFHIENHIIMKQYISPQINRAVKNKSYFYNCYGKEKKFYIENQG